MRLMPFLICIALVQPQNAAAQDRRMSTGGGSGGTERCAYDLPSSGWRGLGFGVPPQNFSRPCHTSGTTLDEQASAEEQALAEACWAARADRRPDARLEICDHQ